MKKLLLLVISAIFLVYIASAQIPNPTVRWLFDPNITVDTTGNHNWTINSTLLSGANAEITSSSNGIIGNSIRFTSNGSLTEFAMTGFTNNASFKSYPETTWSFWLYMGGNLQRSSGAGVIIDYFGHNIGGIQNDTFVNFNALGGLNRTILTVERQDVGFTRLFDIGTQMGSCAACGMDYDEWNLITFTWNQTTLQGYVNGILTNQTTNPEFIPPTRYANSSFMLGNVLDVNVNVTFMMDDLKIFNRTLNSSEIQSLFFDTSGVIINLDSPITGLSTTATTINFSATSTSLVNNLINSTLYIWNPSGNIFTTDTDLITGSVNYTNWTISGIDELGEWKWNVQSCNSGNNCNFASSNSTFTLEASEVISQNYNNNSLETKRETFSIDINLIQGAELSQAQLVYNGTNHTVSNITISGSQRTLTRTIDLPLNPLPFANTTRNFFWRFTFTGDSSSIQTTPIQTQHVGFINFQLCNGTYTLQALNFTLYDEIAQQNIIASSNLTTTFESSWNYWVGSGTVYKNYSYQSLNSSTDESYQFCIFPFNSSSYNFKVNSDIDYLATDYRENEYHLRNATLTNVSSDNLLYLLNIDIATKFFLTFQQGTTLLTDSVIIVQKFFTGLGQYITTSILFTDESGEDTMWQEVDKDYRYTVIKEGAILGVVERTSICAVVPCTLTILVDSPTSNLFGPYYELYADGIVSSLTFNSTTKIITYDFVDTTGLANYFRLEVKQFSLNQTGETICNTQLFSPAGTITCNLTGYNGEFIAKGYISRSPELIDKILNILSDEDSIENLGITGLLLIIGILVTIVFAGAVVGKGSPSVVLTFLAAGILGLKLINWFPFTWTIVVTLEFVIIFILWKVKA